MWYNLCLIEEFSSLMNTFYAIGKADAFGWVWLIFVCVLQCPWKFLQEDFFGWDARVLNWTLYYDWKFGLSICSIYFVIEVIFFHPSGWSICSIQFVIEILLRRIFLSSVRILVLTSCRCSSVTKLVVNILEVFGWWPSFDADKCCRCPSFSSWSLVLTVKSVVIIVNS